MKSVAIIPARGGSKGIPNKNLQLLGGKPLVVHTIEAALASTVDNVIVSTDSEQISDISKSAGADVISRPPELALDTSPTLPVIQHVLSFFNVEKNDIVLTLQPTSPFRNSKHIDESINLFLSVPDADSLISVVRVPHNMVPESIMEIDPNGYLRSCTKGNNPQLRRQDKDQYYARNGAAIYITKSSNVRNYIFGGLIIPYVMNKIASIDIDDMYDLDLARRIIKNI